MSTVTTSEHGSEVSDTLDLGGYSPAQSTLFTNKSPPELGEIRTYQGRDVVAADYDTGYNCRGCPGLAWNGCTHHIACSGVVWYDPISAAINRLTA